MILIPMISKTSMTSMMSVSSTTSMTSVTVSFGIENFAYPMGLLV